MTKLTAIVSNPPASGNEAILSEPMAGHLLSRAESGDGDACQTLGVACSTAPEAIRDLIEAHKWFNLAASYGHEDASVCRADIADEMSSGQIAEAQRRARMWLSACMRRAA